MRAHLKRIAMPKTWPLKRKENVFIVKGRGPHKLELSLPLIVILRDMLKVLNTTAEAKKILNEKAVIINNRVVKDIKFRVGIFDRIYIKKLEKYYTVRLTEKGKLEVVEITEKKSETKPCKIIGKKTLKGNKIQLNCNDGRNFVVSQKFGVGDTIIVDLKTNKIVKQLSFEKGSFVLVYKGSNRGKKGKIESFNEKTAVIEIKNEKISVPKENVFILEEDEYEK